MTYAEFTPFYCDSLVDKRDLILSLARQQLAGTDYDTLVGTGMSGSLIVPMLAEALGKNWLVLRRADDSSHHGRGLPIGRLGERWVFVDDFTETGDTFRYVRKRVAEIVNNRTSHGRYLDPWKSVPALVGAWYYETAVLNQERALDDRYDVRTFDPPLVRTLGPFPADEVPGPRHRPVQFVDAKSVKLSSGNIYQAGWRDAGYTIDISETLVRTGYHGFATGYRTPELLTNTNPSVTVFP